MPGSRRGAHPAPPGASSGWPSSPIEASSGRKDERASPGVSIGEAKPIASSLTWARRRPDAMPAFEKTPGWLDWCSHPSKPEFRVPAGAVDAHCHVFGPGDRFPYAPERKYTPCDAGKARLFALRDQLGFARNVIVQATCHGADNRAMADACRSSAGRARGVATLRRDVSDDELMELHEAGVRGVRFNFVKRLVDSTPREELAEIAARVAR